MAGTGDTLTTPDGTTFKIIESVADSDGERVEFEVTMAPGAMGPQKHLPSTPGREVRRIRFERRKTTSPAHALRSQVVRRFPAQTPPRACSREHGADRAALVQAQRIIPVRPAFTALATALPVVPRLAAFGAARRWRTQSSLRSRAVGGDVARLVRFGPANLRPATVPPVRSGAAGPPCRRGRGPSCHGRSRPCRAVRRG